MSKLILNGKEIEFQFTHILEYNWDAETKVIFEMRCPSCFQYKPLNQFPTKRNKPVPPCIDCNNSKTVDKRFIDKFGDKTYIIYKTCLDLYKNDKFDELVSFYFKEHQQSLCSWSLSHFISKIDNTIVYDSSEIKEVILQNSNYANNLYVTRFFKVSFKTNKKLLKNKDIGKNLVKAINSRNINSALLIIKEYDLRNIDINFTLIKVSKDAIKAFAHILLHSEFDYRGSPNFSILIRLIKSIRYLVDSDHYKESLSRVASNLRYYIDSKNGETPKKDRDKIYKNIINNKDNEDRLVKYLVKYSLLLREYNKELPDEVKKIILSTKID